MTEQKPDERVAWRNTEGRENAGVVTFHRLGDSRTRLMVQMDFVPEGIRERLGDAIGAPERRVKADLERFKQMIEARGAETGEWRARSRERTKLERLRPWVHSSAGTTPTERLRSFPSA